MHRGALLLAIAAAGPATAAAAAPAPGRYAATLCVATSASAPASCGPARLDVLSASSVRLRVADIVYRLTLRSSQLDVSTSQGSMQIDQFSADYLWQQGRLHFVDDDKGVVYEITLKAPARRPR